MNDFELWINELFVIRLGYLPWLHNEFMTNRKSFSIRTPNIGFWTHSGASPGERVSYISINLTLIDIDIGWWTGSPEL